MAKRRFEIKKFTTYSAALKYTVSSVVQEAAKQGQIQIRRRADGYAVVLRKEV